MARNEKRGHHPASLTTPDPRVESLASRGGVRPATVAAKRLLRAAIGGLTAAASATEDLRATIELLAHVRATLDTTSRLVSRALLAAADPILQEEGLRTFAEDGDRLRREDAA